MIGLVRGVAELTWALATPPLPTFDPCSRASMKLMVADRYGGFTRGLRYDEKPPREGAPFPALDRRDCGDALSGVDVVPSADYVVPF